MTSFLEFVPQLCVPQSGTLQVDENITVLLHTRKRCEIVVRFVRQPENNVAPSRKTNGLLKSSMRQHYGAAGNDRDEKQVGSWDGLSIGLLRMRKG